MPYVKLGERATIDNALMMATNLKNFGTYLSTEGELNYVFTEILQGYLHQHGKNYATMNGIIGALEACKIEFYRRLVAPYEDTKITANGDVYGAD